jgi:hypothetical protein
LRSQFATSNEGWGGRRYNPLAFSEHGVAMLSRVLRSQRAVQVNIAIMRAFLTFIIVQKSTGQSGETYEEAGPVSNLTRRTPARSSCVGSQKGGETDGRAERAFHDPDMVRHRGAHVPDIFGRV